MWTADLWHCHGHRFAKAFNRVNHKLKYHQQHQGDSLHRGHHGQKSGIRFKHPVKRTWSRQDKHWTDGRRCLLRGRNQTLLTLQSKPIYATGYGTGQKLVSHLTECHCVGLTLGSKFTCYPGFRLHICPVLSAVRHV